ncbi:MAG TPA: protein phosphatase 2C domain-containing protein [Propionibacteriaceae bacterium]|nr:protein phosphatase 2C domain-containing protein [Propionibacteriaceae bacterium]
MTDHLTQSAAAQSGRETEPDADPETNPKTGSAPLVAIRQADGSLSCPHCGAEVAATEAFCEACGGRLAPTAIAGTDGSSEMAAPIDITRSIQTEADDEDTVVVARPCANCGGVIGPDGYCQTCGAKAPTERDHYTEHPASWVAASCDRGIRHHRNEDATAVAAEPTPGSRAVLVVCDGVSTSVDSDVASLAAARAAREVLVAHRPAGLGTPASRVAAMSNALVKAAASANAAVIESTAAGSENAASCTFAAAVVEGDLVVFGNVGDSRIYWIPDPGSSGEPTELSVDDSVAQARIAMGVARDEAENGPQAHAITKWLGRDSPDFSPRTGSVTVRSPGWVLVCSDGLWNYASEAAAISSLVADLNPPNSDPLALAVALVDWANGRGGKDNISVALARI